ncbi:hypothetical protein XELAEV_18038135mg [Xenopus laevis]|uniref:G-protein coupled receptors family 1 profile domain-containing protein n=1 Tax=Xenopus laevis TaxID=8355 RepID=A0A974C555_XENLA|nr:hypothetical protein XELAEV_18038135mg [Xenopus laevis]
MMNGASVIYFVILGFSVFTDIHLPFFLLFLCIYLIILVGNGPVVTIICGSSSLHAPLNFFIFNLSVLELIYFSVTLSKILANLLSEDKSISFLGCSIQMYMFLTLGTTKFLL